VNATSAIHKVHIRAMGDFLKKITQVPGNGDEIRDADGLVQEIDSMTQKEANELDLEVKIMLKNYKSIESVIKI